ncbi:MAG: Ig-like domain-containing protein [Clostridia bacterium]|nr:Ig-like domain-containing protein [Clostridia bacterium]
MSRSRKTMAFLIACLMLFTACLPVGVGFAQGEQQVEPPVAGEPVQTPETEAEPIPERTADPVADPEPQQTSEEEPAPSEQEALLSLARTDGAAAAAQVNELDDSLFGDYVELVLSARYKEALAEQIEAFSRALDPRGADIVARYAAAAAERAREDLPYVPGEVLLILDNDLSMDRMNAIAGAAGGELGSVNKIVGSTMADVNISMGHTVADAIKAYEKMEGVVYAQPNFLYELVEEQDAQPETDPQTYNDINDEFRNDLWHFNTVHATEAWDVLDNQGGVKTRVAVLDTGVDAYHEDLQANLLTQYCVDSTQDAGDYPLQMYDVSGHGTHVAGIIAATANNGTGVAGVASGTSNEFVEVFVVDVFYSDKANSLDIARGLEYAMDKGAQVINMSLGYSVSVSENYDFKLYDSAFASALDACAEEDIVVIVSAGNDSYTDVDYNSYPSDYEKVVSVIASDEYDDKCSFSNYGYCKDISAPGDWIYSTVASDNNHEAYSFKSGTSMAAPVVTGVAAMIRYTNPTLTAEQIKNILYNTTNDTYSTGWDIYSGYGVVDALEAAKAAVNTRKNVSVTVDVQSVSGSTEVRCGETLKLKAVLTPSWKTETNVTWRVEAGTGQAVIDQNGVLTGIEGGTVTVYAKTNETNGHEDSLVIMVQGIEMTSPADYVRMNQTLQFSVRAGLSVTWSVIPGTGQASITQNGLLTGLSVGTVTVKATANSGHSAEKLIHVLNTPVTGITVSAPADRLEHGSTLQMVASITPSNADVKNVVWSVIPGTGKAQITQAGVLSALSNGTVTVRATAGDGTGVYGEKVITIYGCITGITVITPNDETELRVDDTMRVSAQMQPSTQQGEVIWSVRNITGTATIDQTGLLKGFLPGQVTVRATLKGSPDVFGERTMTIVQPVEKIKLNYANYNLYLGESVDLNATVLPANATNKEVIWESDDPNSVSIDSNGVATAHTYGLTTVYAYSAENDEITAYCYINVDSWKIELSESEVDLWTGQSVTVNASREIMGAPATFPIKWESSNPSVATVSSSGKITAKNPGYCYITCYSTDWPDETFNYVDVYVYRKATKVNISETEAVINIAAGETVGKMYQLEASVYPSSASNANIRWESSDTSVAVVDQNGLVTSTGMGTATIYAIAADGGGAKASCRFTVRPLPVANISMSATSAVINIGEGEALGKTLQLRAQVMPNNALNKTLAWSSSNENVATVDQNGLVTSVGPGTAKIYARALDGSGAVGTCNLTVKIIEVYGISLNTTSATINIGEGEALGKTFQLRAQVMPNNALNKTLAWSSSNENVATVDQNGLVTSVGAGTAMIYARATDGSGVYTKCNLTVKIIQVSQVKLNATSASITIAAGDTLGKTLALNAQVLPVNALNKTLAWSSSNENVATVDQNGLVTSVGAGKAVITAKATDGSGKSARCTVTVGIVKVKSVKLPRTAVIEIGAGEKLGKEIHLVATVTPDNPQNGTLLWTSSNENVATVDQSGVVTSVAPGKAVITAKATDNSGKSAKCTVTVSLVKTKSIKVAKSATIEIGAGESLGKTYKLQPVVTPQYPLDMRLTYSSSNENVATVDQNGLVTSVAPGKAVITVKAVDTGKTAKCTVTVKCVTTTSLSLPRSMTIGMKAGEPFNKPFAITATVKPAERFNEALEWTSSNESVAVIENDGTGRIMGLGSTVITVRAVDTGKTAKCTLTVKNQTTTSIKLPGSVTVGIGMGESIGKTYQLTPTIAPAVRYNEALEWTSSNESVATVDENGLVTTRGYGKATITVKALDTGKTAKTTLTVAIYKTSSIKLPGSVTVGIGTGESMGKTYQLVPTVSPANPYNNALVWSSSNVNVATVDENGLVTSVAPGKAVITVKAVDTGKTAKTTVTVAFVKTTAIKAPKSVALEIGAGESLGKTYQLEPTITPVNRYNSAVTYTSSNVNVAMVDENGLVTSVSPGKAVITVKAVDTGKTAKTTVTVSYRKTSRITLPKTTVLGIGTGESIGKTYQLVPVVTPAAPYNDVLIYTSSNPNVATVDENGVVTSRGIGSTTITVKAADTGKSAKTTLTVKYLIVQKMVMSEQFLQLSATAAGAQRVANLSVSTEPEAPYNNGIVWQSGNTDVAVVNAAGQVTAVAPGYAMIYAKATDGSGQMALCLVLVKP